MSLASDINNLGFWHAYCDDARRIDGRIVKNGEDVGLGDERGNYFVIVNEGVRRVQSSQTVSGGHRIEERTTVLGQVADADPRALFIIMVNAVKGPNVTVNGGDYNSRQIIEDETDKVKDLTVVSLDLTRTIEVSQAECQALVTRCCDDAQGVVSAEDATAILQNTDGDVLSTTLISCGTSRNLEAPDAAATVVNTDGTEVASGSVASGGSLTLNAPDGTTDVQNTDGTTVATGTPPSGGTDTVTAPDASYTVEDQDGTELATGSIPSGDSETIAVTVPRVLELIVNVSSGDDTAGLTIGTNQAGDLNTLSAGGLTSVTYDLNGSPVTLPFTVANGDTLTVSFDTATADTSFTLSGTY